MSNAELLNLIEMFHITKIELLVFFLSERCPDEKC